MSLVGRFQAQKGAKRPSQAEQLLRQIKAVAQNPDAVIINPNQIDVRPQVRKKRGLEPESIAELAASIQEQKQIQPITVLRLDSGRYRLVAGERRLRAIRDVLQRDEISAIIYKLPDGENPDEWKITFIQLSENEQREKLDPLELAEDLKRIKDGTGMSQDQIASSLGFSKGKVSKLLSLLDAPDDVRKAIEAGALPETEYYNNKSLYSKGLPEGFAAESASAAPTPAGQGATRVTAQAPKSRGNARSVSLPFATGEGLLEILTALSKRFKTSPIVVHDKLTRKQLQALLVRHTNEIRKKM